MVIIPTLTHEQLAAAVAPVLGVWSEEVTPSRVELFPNCPYAPAYGWMHAVEKRLKYRVEKIIGRPIGGAERQLFGPDRPISEGLSNAFVHGHRRDPALPIGLRCSVGSEGLALSISDCGSGFDVATVVERAERGGPYYSYAGNGLKSLHEGPGVTASFGDGGRVLHLAIRVGWS